MAATDEEVVGEDAVARILKVTRAGAASSHVYVLPVIDERVVGEDTIENRFPTTIGPCKNEQCSVKAMKVIVGNLVAVTQDVGQAHESVDAKYDGGELTVAFNPEYLLDGIEVAPGEEITLETVDELKPALLRSVGDEDFLYLLMPVRVS